MDISPMRILTVLVAGIALAPAAEPIHIDFAPVSAPPVDGYLTDSGNGCPHDVAGLRFGWTVSDLPAFDHPDARAPDRRYETSVAFQTQDNGLPAFWFIALTNGSYRVHVVAGDPGDPIPDRRYGIVVQGVLAIDRPAAPDDPWLEATTTATVVDGLLRIQQLTSVADNRLCFVDITPLPVELSADIPAASAISPVNIEGTGPSGAAIHVSSAGRDVAVDGLGDATYVFDLPLSAAAATDVQVAQEGSAPITGQVMWTPTALVDRDLTVRAGDSLLVQGPPGAEVRVTSSCGIGPSLTLPSTGLAPYAFAKPGFYTLATDGGAGTLRVTAVGVSMPALIACELGYTRALSVGMQPSGAEAQVLMAANDDFLLQVRRGPTAVPGRMDMTILPGMPGNQRLVARLAGSKAVIAQRAISSFTLRTSAEQYISVVDTYSDGSLLTSARLEMAPLVRGLEIRMHIFVGGVTFLDSTTALVTSTDAFTATGAGGFFPYEMVRAPDGFAKLCHTFVAYQDGIQVSP